MKPHVTGLLTECYFGEFLFMRVLTYDINRMNQWFVSVWSAMVSRFCVRLPSKRHFLEIIQVSMKHGPFDVV